MIRIRFFRVGGELIQRSFSGAQFFKQCSVHCMFLPSNWRSFFSCVPGSEGFELDRTIVVEASTQILLTPLWSRAENIVHMGHHSYLVTSLKHRHIGLSSRADSRLPRGLLDIGAPDSRAVSCLGHGSFMRWPTRLSAMTTSYFLGLHVEVSFERY